MGDKDKKDNNLLGLILIILLGLIVVYGGLFVCKNLFVNKQQFGRVDAGQILGLGQNFNY